MHEQAQIPQIEVYDIDHLGIVAGIIDEIGLVEVIDRQLGRHAQEHISSGQLVKAMILNGLGFVSAPRYLFQEFFSGKATEHLIAPGVRPEHLNDDKLGRVLDKLFAANLTKVFVAVALQAAQHYKVSHSSLHLHLDASSFHVHGAYEREDELPAITITHGYAREHRSDLKQCIIDLICTSDGDVPDLDFGVPAGREDEVKGLLVEMFGPARVAHLAAVATLQGRGAIRAAAQAFGWDNEQIALLHRKQKHKLDFDRYDQLILRAAQAIDGQPHHLLRHGSGIVVADEPLADLVGVAHTPDGPMVLADKDDAEALQVLKFDILPWYLLAIYDQAEATIQAQVYPKPELWQVPGEDGDAGDLLEQADTRAIPYLQSPACMTLLRALRVRTEADLAVCLGALRPGASTTRERLMAAIHGGSAALPGWEVLTPEHQRAISTLLAPSKGAFIFDEDFLRVVNLLGVRFADAERVRKAYKRSSDDATPQLNRLRAAALANGWRDAEIDVVLHWLHFIQRYTFTRGHAVALAHAAWRVARLAAHYPCHFYAAVLDQLGLGVGGGMYPVLVYVTEARRKGLSIIGPSVNSAWQSIPQGSTIHCGLALLRAAISMETLRRIANEARARLFVNVADLRARIDLSPPELERLIAAGALDDLAPSRRQARWEARLASTTPHRQPQLLNGIHQVPLPDIEPEGVLERASEEYATLGFTLSIPHPLALHQDALSGEGLIPTDHLPALVGQEVTLAGVVVAYRRISTACGRPMGFVSLCDASGVAELTLFEAALQAAAETLERCPMVIATGTATDDQERGVGLEVQTLRPIATIG